MVTVAAIAGWTAGADIETNNRMDAIKKVVTFISIDTMIETGFGSARYSCKRYIQTGNNCA